MANKRITDLDFVSGDSESGDFLLSSKITNTGNWSLNLQKKDFDDQLTDRTSGDIFANPVTDISGNLDSLDGRISANDSDISDLNTASGILDNEVSSLENRMSDLQNTGANLETQFSDIDDSVGALDTATGVLENRTDQLEISTGLFDDALNEIDSATGVYDSPPITNVEDNGLFYILKSSDKGKYIRIKNGTNLVDENDFVAYDTERDVGYLGEVSAANFISGDDLAAEFTLTAGTSQNSTAGWLKFYVGPNAFCNRQGFGYLLYTAKRTMRYSISWNDINGAGLVDGSSTIDIGGNTYSVRLMQGADKDPSTFTFGTSCTDNPGENSEWNELLYRVSEKIPDCANPTEGMEGGFSTTRHGGPQNGSNWANFTNSELNVQVGNGRISWCQEVDGPSPSRRVRRGFFGVAFFYTTTASFANGFYGWRPCLQISLQG